MKDLIQNFTNQLRESKAIADKAIVSKSKDIQNIVISGLGGSGIGGTIVSELISDSCKIPVIINKDYSLPEFVNEHTLFIVSSYSGNTEETLNALNIAIIKKCIMSIIFNNI
jgi:glucose/mannose-6-phosphate isomerase